MMKKFVGILSVLLLSACHVGQLTTLYTDKTSYDVDGVRFDANNHPITGLYHKYSKTMRLKEEIHYVDGLISGLYLVYNNKGKIILNAQYYEGLPHGKVILYYDDGYFNGKFH